MHTTVITDPYELLHIDKKASKAEIHDAYTKRSQELNPDRFDKTTNLDEWNQANEEWQELNEAYRTIMAELETSSLRNDLQNPSARTNTENRKQPSLPTSPPTIPSGIVSVWGLPNSTLNKLIARQKDKADNQLTLVSKKIYRYLLYSSAAGVWAILLGWLTERFVWSFVHQVLFIAGSLLFCTITGIFLAKAIYWFWRPLKPGIIVTPLHLIVIDETGTIKFKSLELLQNIVIRNTKTLGMFRGATVLLDFVGSTTYLNVDKVVHANSLEVALSVYCSNLKNASFQVLHDLAKKHNDFHDVETNARIDTKTQLRSTPPLLGSLAFGLLLGVAVFVTGDYLNDGYRQKIEYERNLALKNAQLEASLSFNRSPLIRPEPIKPAQPQIPVVPRSRPDPTYTAPTSGYIESSGAIGKIPIKFVTEGGGIHYFVRISNSENGALVHSLIVRSGQTLRVFMPEGKYSFEYTAGSKWSNESKSFGNDEIRYTDSQKYDLKIIPGRPVFGKTLELKSVVDKNRKNRQIQVTAYDLAVG